MKRAFPRELLAALVPDDPRAAVSHADWLLERNLRYSHRGAFAAGRCYLPLDLFREARDRGCDRLSGTCLRNVVACVCRHCVTILRQLQVIWFRFEPL